MLNLPGIVIPSGSGGGSGSGLIASMVYESSHNYPVTNKMTFLDSTNLVLAISAPTSGNAIVQTSFVIRKLSTSTDITYTNFGLYDTATDDQYGAVCYYPVPAAANSKDSLTHVTFDFYVSGLSAGSHSMGLAAVASADSEILVMVGTCAVTYNSGVDTGTLQEPVIMKAWAA